MDKSQETVKWLDSLTESEHDLNLVAYYHTLTTERNVQLQCSTWVRVTTPFFPFFAFSTKSWQLINN